jgi:flavodoxin
MSNALIVYHSKTGTTKKFGFAIRDYILSLGIESKTIPSQNFIVEDLVDVDFLFLGCWTNGLFVIMQGPEKEWVEFSRKLPDLNNKKVALFTTYKLLTGSMFARMKKQLKLNELNLELNLKSRDINLSNENKLKIKQFIS